MAKLIVTLGEQEVQRFDIGAQPVSIGRLPDNQLVIDTPTVSAHHARVYREGPHYVLEDLKSTNGTIVNNQPIARHSLLEGDVVIIGKHALIFTREGEEPAGDAGAAPFVPDVDDTVPVYETVVPKTAAATSRGRPGTIKIVSGQSAESQYTLTAMTTVIGKAETAVIRLRGWFAPQVAAAITRGDNGYTLSPIDGKVSVNGERVSGRRELASGDLIVVGGLTLEFTLPDS